MPVPGLLQRRWPAVALVAIVFALTYWGSEVIAREPVATLLPTALDRHIPLVESAIWGYLSAIVLVAIALVVPRGEIRARTVVAMALGCVIAAAIFIAWPTTIARPADLRNGGLVRAGWAFLYSIDTERNAFPSLHATFAVVAAAALRRSSWPWQAVGYAWALAVLVAALVVRQHYVIDLFAGVALGALAWLLAGAIARVSR